MTKIYEHARHAPCADSLIPYAAIFYCYAMPRGVTAEIGFMLGLMFVVLPIFFTLLCDAADIFICPTMALLSQAIPGLKPRVAGGGMSPDAPD